VTYFAGIYNWELDPRILGYEWAVLGIVLILTTPIFLKYAPAAASIYAGMPRFGVQDAWMKR